MGLSIFDRWFRAQADAQLARNHELTDEAVLHAVNLGAMVHNLLGAYEQAMLTGDYERFTRKMYDLSVEFHKAEVAEARENMRLEWVLRCTRRGFPVTRKLDDG